MFDAALLIYLLELYSTCPLFTRERKISSRIEAATNSDEEDSAESDSEESGDLANQVASVESPVHRTRSVVHG